MTNPGHGSTRKPPPGPLGRSPLTPRQVLVARVAGVVGLLAIVLSLVVVAAAFVGGSTIDDGDSYVWRSGSELFLNNSFDHHVANCTITTPAENRWVTVGKRPNSLFENFETNGKWVKRFASGPIRVTCDNEVAVSSGPLLRLYPLGATPWPFLTGLVLVCFWQVRRGGRFTQIFFGPRSRPLLPDRRPE